MIILGIILWVTLATIIIIIADLTGDILMIKYLTKISWKDSIICGLFYFRDRFKRK